MKVRNGFVSNSSTSSFVVIAIKIEDITPETRKQIYDDHLLLADGDNEYIGKTLLYTSDDGPYTFEDASEFVKELSDAISEITSKPYAQGPIQIIHGCRYDGGIVEEE